MKNLLLTLALTMIGALAANSAPDWLRNAEVYNGWYKAWDAKVISEKMAGIPLVVGAPADRKIVEAAHRQGTRVIAYMTIYQMPMDSSYQGNKLADHPEWVLIDANGENSRSCFWNSENYRWYEVCDNSPGYRKAVLDYVKRILDSGVDGIFIDNAHPAAQCFGEKLGKHKHAVPGTDNAAAWASLVREIVRVVKAKNPDNVVILNPGEPSDFLRGLADGIMIESYICTHASKTRWHNWDRILQWARDWGDGPDQIVALSYIGHTSNPPREDAFYCYASAKLSGFLWADWYSKFEEYKDLFSLRLGPPQGRMHRQGPIYYRAFENGVVAVNPGSQPASLSLPMPGHYAVVDQFTGKLVDLERSILRVEIPAESGRIYVVTSAAPQGATSFLDYPLPTGQAPTYALQLADASFRAR